MSVVVNRHTLYPQGILSTFERVGRSRMWITLSVGSTTSITAAGARSRAARGMPPSTTTSTTRSPAVTIAAGGLLTYLLLERPLVCQVTT